MPVMTTSKGSFPADTLATWTAPSLSRELAADHLAFNKSVDDRLADGIA
jgi:hypothetical protein